MAVKARLQRSCLRAAGLQPDQVNSRLGVGARCCCPESQRYTALPAWLTACNGKYADLTAGGKYGLLLLQIRTARQVPKPDLVSCIVGNIGQPRQLLGCFPHG